MSLCIVILTKNEEKNILDCIESIPSDFEIIVVDDYSTDRTIEVVKSIARKNIRVLEHKLDDDFASQRNFALSKANSEWVLFIDADERISHELGNEIVSTINHQPSTINGYYVKRADTMWGKQLKHGESGNIKIIRLAKKDSGKWKGKVHEVWDVKGPIGKLTGPIIHYPHQSLSEFLSEISFYSTLRAKELHQERIRASFWQIFFYPKAKFAVNYFFKLGFLDGIPGLIFAIMMSLHSYLVRSKLWLLSKS